MEKTQEILEAEKKAGIFYEDWLQLKKEMESIINYRDSDDYINDPYDFMWEEYAFSTEETYNTYEKYFDHLDKKGD